MKIYIATRKREYTGYGLEIVFALQSVTMTTTQQLQTITDYELMQHTL